MDFHRRNGVSSIKLFIYRHVGIKYFDQSNALLYLRTYKKSRNVCSEILTLLRILR